METRFEYHGRFFYTDVFSRRISLKNIAGNRYADKKEKKTYAGNDQRH